MLLLGSQVLEFEKSKMSTVLRGLAGILRPALTQALALARARTLTYVLQNALTLILTLTIKYVSFWVGPPVCV